MKDFDPKIFDSIADPVAPRAQSLASAPPEPKPPQEPSPTRAVRTVRAVLGLALALCWLGYVMRYWGLRADITAMYVAIPLALWVLGVGYSLYCLIKPDTQGLVRNVRVAWAVVMGLPILFLVSAGLGAIGGEPLPFTWEYSFPCIMWSGIAGCVPILAAVLLFRRSFVSAPVWRGSAIGAAIGLSAGLTIHAVCPYTDAAHVLVTHGLPILAGALLGAGLGALGGRI